uniref:G-protein coupled receptors family 1 profile domain-containing protein n=1 Tax=Branchiostoma floridae TaxID=7739 RepID=C3YQV0_BRAFL|eukprot:XP_002601279.1 hypothetical protein BRAFLDRAFT_81319 [Branchiostoma floridae]
MEEETAGPSVKVDINRVLSIDSTSRDLQTAYLITSLVLSVGCGLLLIFLVWKKESLQKPSYYLRCNLAVDDVIFTSVMIPIRIYALFQQDVFGKHLLCIGRTLVVPTCVLSMFGTYLLMAIDLYQFVCHPLHYHERVTTKRVGVSILTIRAFSLFLVAAPVAFGGLPKYGMPCQIDPENTVSISLININIIVLSSTILAIPMFYYRVFKEARKQQERDENRDLWVFQTKAFKMMLPHAIVLTVSVATTVFQVAITRAVISKEQMSQRALIVADHVSALLFLTLSSMANPIICSFRLPEFRRAIRELCGFPTNTPPAVSARRRDMEMAAITSRRQVAHATELVPAQSNTNGLKPAVEDIPSDQAQGQTTRGDEASTFHRTPCQCGRFKTTVAADSAGRCTC